MACRGYLGVSRAANWRPPHVPVRRAKPRSAWQGNSWRTTLSFSLGLTRCRSASRGLADGYLHWADDVASELPLAPKYLATDLAACLIDAGKAEGDSAVLLANQLLKELSLEIGSILTLNARERAGRLDGLMDLSPASDKRELRRRLHQALCNMVRWFRHDPSRFLADLDPAAEELRSYVASAVARKRELRRLSQRSVAFSTSPPSSGDEEANVDAAAVHGFKRWSVAFKEWCFQSIRYYFLLDPGLRSKWLTGQRAERFRVTSLSHALRRLVLRLERPLDPIAWRSAVQAEAAVLVERPRVLDVGSCSNWFGRHYGESLDVTALDLAPGHSSVHRCDFLKLTIAPMATKEGQLVSLPAEQFDVVVMALLFSVLPDDEARGIAASKARALLKSNGHGLLILADTKGTLGLHSDPVARQSDWVRAVEAHGFKLASDPQLHLSREHVKGRNGYWQRSFCWSFWTTEPRRSMPIPVLNAKTPRVPPERLRAQELRDERRRARARKAALLKAFAERPAMHVEPRLRRPEVTIHDLPEDMQEIEA